MAADPTLFDEPKNVQRGDPTLFDDIQGDPTLFDTEVEPTASGVGKQFIVGAANAAAFNLPEIFDREKFEGLESDVPGERFARGVGTAVGSVVGLPGAVFKLGTRLATKGLAKAAPKMLRLAAVAKKAKKGTELAKAASRAALGKAVVEGAGATGLVNAIDPSIPVEEKPRAVIEGMASGATVGALFHQAPKVVRSIISKNKKTSSGNKAAINEAVKPPGQFTSTGQEVNPNPRADLVPSIKRQVPKEARSVLENLQARQTEILAADRGVLSAKEQVNLSKGVNAQGILDGWKPGQIVNAEALFATRINLAERVLKLQKNTPAEVIEKLSSDFIKADAMASEVGRALGSLNTVQSLAANQLKFISESFANLSPQGQKAAKRVFKQFQTPGFWDKFMEFRTASLLTSPFTQLRNLAGNTIPRLFSPLEKGVAGITDRIVSGMTGRERKVFAREGAAEVFGVIRSLGLATKNAVNSLRNENFVSQERIAEAIRFKRSISGITGQTVRLPFRALGAVDEFFTTLGKNASLHSQAMRQALKEKAKDVPGRISELVRNPTTEMIELARQSALKDTFRQPLGPAANLLQKALNAPNPMSRTMKFIIPFFRTPVNLFKWTAERAPGISFAANWKALAKGTSEQRSEAIGKIVIGQLVSAGILSQALDGHITGKLSRKRKERELLQAQGIQPYSVKVGDKYVSYRSYEPISSWLGLIANLSEELKEGKKINENKVSTVIMETVKMMKDQSFLRGLSDLTNALDDPERFGERFTRNAITSLIPTGVGYIARLQDPVVRQPDSIPDSIKTKLPYFSKQVPERLDIWGRPITREGTLMQRALLPSGVTTEKPDMVGDELLALEEFPSKISKSYKGLNLTVQERNEVSMVENRLQKQLLDRLVQTSDYQRMNDEQRAQAINTIFRKVRIAVRQPYLKGSKINNFFVSRLRKLNTQEERLELIEKFTNRRLTTR